MATCAHCGGSVDADDRFCAHCGAALLGDGVEHTGSITSIIPTTGGTSGTGGTTTTP